MQRIRNRFLAFAYLGCLLSTSVHAKDLPALLTAPAGGVKVVIVYSSECPISNEYSPTLKALAGSLPKQAEIVGVSVNYDQTDAELKQHAKEHELAFPVICDRTGSIIKTLGVTITPEAVVLDDAGKVRYRGRIDDQFADRGKRNNHPESRDLANAVTLALAGKTAVEPWPKAVGCPIPAFPAQVAAPKTYARDVLPIIQKNCLECHRKGQVGPFALETYEQARKRADDLANVASDRRMPPWKAIHGFGPNYQYDKSLSDDEIKTLSSWAEAGAPEGNPAEAPATPTFREDWTLGTPDLVLEPASEFDIPASGGDIYRCFVLPTNLPKDVYVRACEVKAGNRRVVHHVLSYVDMSGQGRKKDAADAEQGYECFGGPGVPVHSGLFGWAPGNEAHFLPDGVGVSLPKGGDVIMQVHYHPDGKPEKDRTRLGLYFAKMPVKQSLHNAFALNQRMVIPAGDSHREIKARWKVPVDVTVLSATPHMHQIGRDMAMTFHLPDGKAIPLVKIDDWDFNWQLTYWFEKQINIPKDSTLDIIAHYDNSAKNPRNPNNPPQEMHWGEATTDEMCIGFVALVKTGQDLTRPGEVDDLGKIMRKAWEDEMKKYEEQAKRRAAEEKKAK